MASSTSALRPPRTPAESTTLDPGLKVTGSSAQAAVAGTVNKPASPTATKIRFNFDRMCNPSARLRLVQAESVVPDCSSAPTPVKPQVAVAIQFDSMVPLLGRPQ